VSRKTIAKKPKARTSVRRGANPEKIPKKDRREHYELLWQRVYVIWDAVQGPTCYYGTVVKFDSNRKGAPFYVVYYVVRRRGGAMGERCACCAQRD
jgi:hypothetical protein